MNDAYCGFVDAGYLRAEGANVLGIPKNQARPSAQGVVEFLKYLGIKRLPEWQLLRTYWYDGAYDSSHPNHAGQKQFFKAIAATPSVKLRLGHLAERKSPRMRTPIRNALRDAADDLDIDAKILVAAFERHWEWRPELTQKGVDTLIALDMVRLAHDGVYGTAVLIAGDRDLADAVDVVQEVGRRVVIATPKINSSISSALRDLADDILEIPDKYLSKMIVKRPGTAGDQP